MKFVVDVIMQFLYEKVSCVCVVVGGGGEERRETTAKVIQPKY